MNQTENAAPPQADTIALEIDLQHSQEKVWRALTDPVLLEEWLLPVFNLELTQGSEFMFKTQPYPEWDGTVKCRILEIDEHRKISYTWDAIGLNTVVTFTLTPTASGTLLSLLQTGFKPDQKRESGGARYGWNMMTGKLVALLARL